jgi:hypothetical protein
LTDPETQEREAKEARIQEIVRKIAKAMYPDWEDEDDEDGDDDGDDDDDDGDEQAAGVVKEEDFEIDEAKIAMEALAELLDTVLLAKYFPLALARYVLRRAA